MDGPLTDAAGRDHQPASSPRILSLVPSLTELVVALGLRERLVGRTQFCIHPKHDIADVPAVGGTKKIHMDKAMASSPTHAIVNIDENPKDMADALAAAGVNVVVTHPRTPDDNPALYRFFGDLFGAKERADELASQFDNARRTMLSPDAYHARRVLYLIWKDPWMAVRSDTYIGNMLGLVNWSVVTPHADPTLTGDAARYPTVTINEDTLSQADLVLFSSEPYSFNEDHIDTFQRQYPGHAEKAHIIDGEMTSWYGPRAIAGLSYIRTFAGAVT